jgi:type VI secretion system protein ImpE
MNPTELFRTGNLQAAIEGQVQEVKAHPADRNKRLFLFELLCFAGDFERARKHIEAVSYPEVELERATQAYRHLLDAEEVRARVFRDGIMPQFLTKPPESLFQRLEAVNCLRGNRAAEAAALLRQLDEKPEVKGRLNDRPFEGLRDCDDLFGPVLEVMAHGDYYWLPLEQVETLTLKEPQFPRDLIWLPGKLTVREGPTGDVFLPALYPGSHQHPDDQVRLGRLTDWKQVEGGPVRGVGRRTFLEGDEGITLLEWRDLTIAPGP